MRSNEDNYEDLAKIIKQIERELPDDNERKTVYQKNMFKQYSGSIFNSKRFTNSDLKSIEMHGTSIYKDKPQIQINQSSFNKLQLDSNEQTPRFRWLQPVGFPVTSPA